MRTLTLSHLPLFINIFKICFIFKLPVPYYFFFQDYVNTLATIKQENGEKYLILKKKYFPEFYSSPYSTDNNNSGAPSSLTAYHQSHLPDYNYNPLPEPQSSYVASNQLAAPAYAAPPYRYAPGGGGGNGGGSPSLLDEVMAGFVPPSRTLARQLPSLPTHYAGSDSPPPPPLPSSSSWSQPVGLPVGGMSPPSSSLHSMSISHGQYYPPPPPRATHPADLGLPLPPPASGRDSRRPYDRQASLPQYDRSTLSQAADPLPVPYDRQHSSPGFQYERHQSAAAGGRYGGAAPDELYNPSAFSPHAHNPSVANSRQSVSSLASFSSSGLLFGQFLQFRFVASFSSSGLLFCQLFRLRFVVLPV